MLEGAKREAAKNKPPTKKAQSLTQQEIHSIIDKTIWKHGNGIIGPDPDLIMWRTVVRLYTYYKTFCRWDGFQQLTTENITFHEDHVSIEFKRSKNDQFYSGTYSLLAVLPGSPYCPKLIYSTYFTVMNFKCSGIENLNCRILKTKTVVRPKPKEKLCYSNSARDTKQLLFSIGFVGKYSEKSFKV